MTRVRPLAIVAGLLALPMFLGAASEPKARLKVLFLGDRGHHRPADRAAQLVPVMKDRGIDVTYTEKMGDLNPETLAKYDALIVYANTDDITPERAKALVDYVENGGGFVPLHCASFCFRNSDAYVKLVGAQFQRHGTGEFDTKVVDASHPIMKGLEPFRTWDETYVHSKHNAKDRQVLQVRAEGDGEEPWTWVRTQGKGRVFYTAYGHDGRTWGHPGFQNLVERGIRWAANKGEVYDEGPRPNKGLKAFEYEESADKIPNYLAGRRWGTQGETINRMQEPLTPADSAKHLVLPKGFEAKLFVSEPQIGKPLCMAWDHKGRLWIAESTDYPNNLKKPGTGDDKIKICEDTDGDGKADKFTIFADKLSIPTSLVFANGGLIVSSAPEMIFLRDRDGDDKADERKVLFTGWGTNDTHAGPSNLHYGFDNWIWGIVGYSGFNGTVGGERFRFGQGFFRFKPDGSKLEFLRSTNNNSWGVSFTEEGLVFGSTANGCPSVYLPIPNRYYESVKGWSPSVLGSIAGWNRFFPITEKVRQVDHHGGFTAAAGHAIYTARAYPKAYWNKTAFVAEPTGHLTATFVLEPDGSDFRSNNTWNLVASDDEWTAPIAAEVGPDGQVWVIDWYNYIVQHNPTPAGFKTGKGAAYETPLRDKTHGRIYRIVATEGSETKAPKLDPKDGKGLVAALGNDNLLWRLQAQRLIVERGNKDVVPALVAMLDDKGVDAVGLNPGAIHALNALRGLEAVDAKAALTALKHPSAGVRINALRVSPRDEATAKAILEGGLLDERDAQVKLAALLALAEMPASEANGKALAKALLNGTTERDRWLGDALTAASAANARAFLVAVAESPTERLPSAFATQLVGRVAEHYARGGPADSVGRLLAACNVGLPQFADAIVNGLVKGWPKDRPAKLTEADEKAMVALLPKLSDNARGPLVSLASRWGSQGLSKYTAEIAKGLMATVKDEAKGDAARGAAAGQLIAFASKDPSHAAELLAMITPRTSPALASGLIAAIGKSEAPKVGAALVDALPALTPAARAEAIRTLIGREDWAGDYLDGVEAGKSRLDELSLDQKQALAAYPNAKIATRAKGLMAKGGGLPDADRQKVIDQLSAAVLRPGDAVKGKQVFVQQCAKCHRHGGEGGKVGPDLTGMAAHPKTELLVNILDPSRSVEGNFVSYTVATADGRTFNGLLASETRTAVELIDTEGKTNKLLREDIEELVASKKSLMPEGFEKQIPAESLADLLEFLTQRGKFMPLDLRKVATVNSNFGMFFDRESTVERLVLPDWAPRTIEGVPFALIDPENPRINNVVMLRSRNGTVPPRMPLAVSLPCNAPAKAIHFLSGVSGWGSQNAESGNHTVSMIVRLTYAGGETEDHPLRDGVEFADYIRRIDVPGSKFAFAMRGQQMRYLAVHPKKTAMIESIELVKGPDQSAPLVMAVTVELP